MTSPATPVTVQCPGCGQIYEDYYRPSINTSLGENWTNEEIAEATTVKCPKCGVRVTPGSLVVGFEGSNQ